MNYVYVRVLVYSFGGMMTALGIGTLDPVAGTLTLNLEELATSLAAGGALSGLVFGIWGKK